MRVRRKERIEERVLAEWRGLAEPLPVENGLSSVAEAMPAVLDALGLKERFEEEEMLGEWRGLVGEFIALHSAPVSVRRKVLLVRVLQPALHYNLDRTLKRSLLERFQNRFGAERIRDIRFTLG